MPTPYYYLSLNAENPSTYHVDAGTLGEATLTSGDGETGVSVWSLANHHADVTLTRDRFDGTGAIRQTTAVTNTGDASLVVDSMSSLFVPGIGETGEKRWYEKRFILHYACSAWQGEGQWHHDYVEELGLYPTYNHNHQTSFRLQSTGSWTTARRHPLILLEDTLTGETWYFEILTGASWYIEVNVRGYQNNSGLCVMLSACHEKQNGWYRVLAPGESVTTPAAVYGCVKGGFEEAIRDLLTFKRATFHTDFSATGGVVPVCFNDYMNCLWARPTRECLSPLVKAAAKAGCEVFCIDAGWFGEPDVWSMHNGDWQPYDPLFGEGGLRGMIKEIADAGMLPGVWLELETVDIRSDFAKAHPECLLTRHGCPIGQYQCFMDFRRPEVRAHLMQVFDDLYAIGVRYVKNDYNHSTGVCIDSEEGRSGAEALLAHTQAFYSFIDEVLASHPGFMIENCGSGAMRCDHETLSHFHVQSTSDQEFYDRYPSIVQGMVACMPPERAGIWAYPYPLDIHDRDGQRAMYPVTAVGEKIIAGAADGWQTAFNMVNGMMGCLYLSGRICYADEKNAALIAEAVSLYKDTRRVLMGAHPVYPQGPSLIFNDGWTSLGLLNEKAGKLLLSVWRMRDDTPSVTLDLSKYLSENASVARAYPGLDGFSCSLNDRSLTLTLPSAAPNAAAWLEIEV